MNLDELARAARTALDAEYAHYTPAAGRPQFEESVVSETGPPVTDEPGESDEQPAHTSSWVTEWSTKAACRTTDPDELFVQGAAQNRAKTVCAGCPVRTECLADALDNRVEFGIWGGLTERERRALLRRRPHVTSWRRLLESARTEYERSTSVRSRDGNDERWETAVAKAT